MYTRRFVAMAGLAVLGGLTSAARADVKLELRPLLTQAACIGQEFEVGLFASTTNPQLFATGEAFSGIQVVLAWDNSVLELMGASTAASSINWSINEFLAGDVAGLNEASIPKDGDAFYWLTAQFSNNPPRATSVGVLATVFRFKALVQTTIPTAITILGSSGIPPNALSTRVSDAFNPGLNILAGSGAGVVSQFAIPVTCTRTLSELEINGPSIVTTGSSGQCQALASFLEGFTLNVTGLSSWRIVSGPGSIDPNTGIYTAPISVSGSVQVVVEATFVDQGILRTATKQFTVIEQPANRIPTGLTVNGPSEVNENEIGQCFATAFFSNAPQADVTSNPGTFWQVLFGPGSIDNQGRYFVVNVDQDVQVTIGVTYTENGITVPAQPPLTKTFIVRNLTVQLPQLTGLRIEGQLLVPVGRIASYSAIATFNDGSEADVTLQSSWLVLSGPGAILSGDYQAPTSVSGPTPVTIQAFFTDLTGSQNATLDITVIEPQPAVDLILRPALKTGDVGDIFRCELFAISNAPFDQTFHALNAILSWDRFVLEFIGTEMPQGVFSTSGVFQGDPHNCNEADPPADGTALFIGFAPLSGPVIATPYETGPGGEEIGGTLIATVVLRAIAPGTGRVEVTGMGCELVQGRLKQTTVVDSDNPGLNITGLLGFSRITVSGVPGGGTAIVLTESPTPDTVLNRKADPIDTTKAGGRVSVTFADPETNVNIQVVGVQNGTRTGVHTVSNGGRTHTVNFSPFLPDRDRYNVTVRVGSLVVAQWSFVKLVGDCNRSRSVEILDAAQLRSALKTGIYNPNCDFDGNGSNNILDFFDLRVALKDGAFVQ